MTSEWNSIAFNSTKNTSLKKFNNRFLYEFIIEMEKTMIYIDKKF